MRPFLKGELHVILADEPTQGVDVGARLDIYDALRGQGRRGCRGAGQVQRPDRAVRAVRPRRRDVPWSHRRRDPQGRPRRAPDHLGDRRADVEPTGATMATTIGQTRGDTVRRLHLGRWLPILAMLVLIVAPRCLHQPPGAVVHVGVQPQRSARRHDAAGAGGDGADERVDGAGVRRLGRRADDDVRGHRLVRADAGPGGWQLVLGVLAVIGVALAVGTTT